MKSSPSFTDKKLFISLNSVGIILTAIATLCISLAISTFFISKKYRSHPGSLVLGLCFSELFRYYANFWIMEETLASLTTEQGFNFFERTSCWFKELSFGILDPGENNLYTMTSCISAMCLEIGNIYYMFISVDIFLLLRNPFYSPKRRIFLYHVIAISLPLSIFLPLRILDEGDKYYYPNISFFLYNFKQIYINLWSYRKDLGSEPRFTNKKLNSAIF